MSAIDTAFENQLLARREGQKQRSTERIYANKFASDLHGELAKTQMEYDTKFYEQYINALGTMSEFDDKNPKHNIYMEGNKYMERRITKDTGEYGDPVEISATEYLRKQTQNTQRDVTRTLVMQGYLPGKVKLIGDYNETDVAMALNQQQVDKSKGVPPPKNVEVDKDKVKVDGKTAKDKVKEETEFNPITGLPLNQEQEFFVPKQGSKPFQFNTDVSTWRRDGIIKKREDFDPTIGAGDTQLIKHKASKPNLYRQGLSDKIEEVKSGYDITIPGVKGGMTAGGNVKGGIEIGQADYNTMTNQQKIDLEKMYRDAIAKDSSLEGSTATVNAQGKLVFKQK